MNNQKTWEERFDEEFSYTGELTSDDAVHPLRVMKEFIRTEKELSRQEGEAFKGKAKREAYMQGYREAIESIVLGAIPETTDYANGWNDCRKTLGRIKAELKGKNE